MNAVHFEIVKESNQNMNNKRKESFAWCDEPKDTKVNREGKSFKPISKIYFHNCHGCGNYVVDCKKPKFNNYNTNSRMCRNTNHVGNRRRSHSNESGERR